MLYQAIAGSHEHVFKIGAPARLTIGKRTVSEGTVDLQARRGREQISTSVRDAPERAQAILQEGA